MHTFEYSIVLVYLQDILKISYPLLLIPFAAQSRVRLLNTKLQVFPKIFGRNRV